MRELFRKSWRIFSMVSSGVDAAGVAVIGAVSNAGTAAVRLAHHETRTYRRYRQEVGQTSWSAWNC